MANEYPSDQTSSQPAQAGNVPKEVSDRFMQELGKHFVTTYTLRISDVEALIEAAQITPSLPNAPAPSSLPEQTGAVVAQQLNHLEEVLKDFPEAFCVYGERPGEVLILSRAGIIGRSFNGVDDALASVQLTAAPAPQARSQASFMHHVGNWKCLRCPFEVPYDPSWSVMSDAIQAHYKEQHPYVASNAPSEPIDLSEDDIEAATQWCSKIAGESLRKEYIKIDAANRALVRTIAQLRQQVKDVDKSAKSLYLALYQCGVVIEFVPGSPKIRNQRAETAEQQLTEEVRVRKEVVAQHATQALDNARLKERITELETELRGLKAVGCSEFEFDTEGGMRRAIDRRGDNHE